MKVFETLRDIIAKSEKEMKQSIELLHKMRPKNIEDHVHNKMIEDLLHEEIELGKWCVRHISFRDTRDNEWIREVD